MDTTLDAHVSRARNLSPPASAFSGRYGPLIPHGALVVFVAFANWFCQEPADALYVSGAAATIVYLYLALLEARRAPLWWSPLSFYFLWYAIVLGPGAIHFASQ